MKKFLIIGLVVVLAVVMMAVPAFAATSYVGVYDDNSGYYVVPEIPAGDYIACIGFDSGYGERVEVFTEQFHFDSAQIDVIRSVDTSFVLNGVRYPVTVDYGHDVVFDCYLIGSFVIDNDVWADTDMDYAILDIKFMPAEQFNEGDSGGTVIDSIISGVGAAVEVVGSVLYAIIGEAGYLKDLLPVIGLGIAYFAARWVFNTFKPLIWGF